MGCSADSPEAWPGLAWPGSRGSSEKNTHKSSFALLVSPLHQLLLLLLYYYYYHYYFSTMISFLVEMMPDLSSARDWMNRDMACHGMDFGTSACTACTSSTGSACTCACAWIVFFVCFLALTAIYYAYHVVLCSDLSYTDGYFFRARRSVITTVGSCSVDISFAIDDDDKNYDETTAKNDSVAITDTDTDTDNDDVQETDGEPSTTPDVNIFCAKESDRAMEGVYSCDVSVSASASNTMRPKKFNYRVLYVIRRTNPLYWDHPELCQEEYQIASRNFSPARFFVKAGRALPSILEEEKRVHFLEEVVLSTHVVPRDGLNEIARRALVPSKKKCKKFLSEKAGRAMTSIRKGRVHFLLAEDVLSTPVVRRDNLHEIAQEQGMAMAISDTDTDTASMMDNDNVQVDESQKEVSLDCENKSCDDDEDFDYDIDDFPDDDDHDPIPIAEDTSSVSQAIDDAKKNESSMPDLSFDQGVRVQPLRRSTRIAERRERQELQSSIGRDTDSHIPSQVTKSTTTIAIATDIHSEESSAIILGSIFVDGRRLSARKLAVKSDKTVEITCHRYPQCSRSRSRSSGS
ncbi:MAG: hypothetical protein ACK5TW_00120 [Cyanobacteriota bacterium]